MSNYFDINATRELLKNRYKEFYHFTVDKNIDSIKAIGLSPDFENDQSRYPNRTYEPTKAVRYCTLENICGGKSAAERYMCSFDYQKYISVDNGARLVKIAISASTLLDRNFGLDFSNSLQRDEAIAEINKNSLISPDFFLNSIIKHGCISCYDSIPVSDFVSLEIL